MTASPDEDELWRRARERIGTTIRGKYCIEDVIGVGGMAVVYRATHRNRAEFAIKLLHPELSFHQELRARFLREGYAANSVKHSGVVQVVDDDIAEDGSAFLVMELLRGESADALSTQHGDRLPVDAVVAIGDQLLDVLATAHANGIVHRDIKPANLFLTRDGTVKVLDFGIARVRDVAISAAGTHTGVLLGTPAYMAPEQAAGLTNEIDARTDIWAVGATMFALLSGQFVHQKHTPELIIISSATTAPRTLSSIAPHVPRAVAEVIDRALSFDKAARYHDAASMRASLRAAYHVSSRDVIVRALESKPLRLTAPNASVKPVGATTARPVSGRAIVAPRTLTCPLI